MRSGNKSTKNNARVEIGLAKRKCAVCKFGWEIVGGATRGVTRKKNYG